MARRGLGKGLDALFQTYETEINDNENKTGQRTELRINDIDPNIDQPRQHFDQESINELGKSILEHGVVQPILVKQNNSRYTIIAEKGVGGQQGPSVWKKYRRLYWI